MSVVKSYSVGNGDMFYIKHNSDNFTIIDCNVNSTNANKIIEDLKCAASGVGMSRFISTHPDQDHFGGIEILNEKMPIHNFYCVENRAIKAIETTSFNAYRALRDGTKCYNLQKGCKRKWLNDGDEERGSSGISVLWPNTNNPYYIAALDECNRGASYNNVSTVLRYEMNGGASFMWLGDLETQFMEDIIDDIELEKTTVVFAAHHGRSSGKIPDSWLRKLDPQIIVIGEAPSRHLNYYTGYRKITQNRAGDITFDLVNNYVHIYASSPTYRKDGLINMNQSKFEGYIGSLIVETEYTL